jgi:hypothetical protein
VRARSGVDREIAASVEDNAKQGGRVMAEQDGSGVGEFLAIRTLGAHLDDVVLQPSVDLRHDPKFPRVDDTVIYRKAALDIRQQLEGDSGADDRSPRLSEPRDFTRR